MDMSRWLNEWERVRVKMSWCRLDHVDQSTDLLIYRLERQSKAERDKKCQVGLVA